MTFAENPTCKAKPIPLIKYAHTNIGNGGAEHSMEYAITWDKEPTSIGKNSEFTVMRLITHPRP